MNNANTKEAIIYHALSLFSDRGYDGVSMRDIASAVGIKAASIYNHFKSKDDIFNSIIEEMSIRYEETAMKIQMPLGDMDEVVEYYMSISENILIESAKNMFLYFLEDDFASKFRRMITIEQFRNKEVGKAYVDFYIDGAVVFQKELFASMIKRGIFIECDPYIMAFHFYSPIFLLLNKYDCLNNNPNEAIAIIEKHVKQFSALYNKPST